MILIAGIGNTLRGDDGVGPWVAEQLEKMSLPDVECRAWQQLPLELLEELQEFECAVIVDCAQSGSRVRFEQIAAAASANPASSHHLSPEGLARLAAKLYDFNPDIWLCSIPGEQFEVSDAISPQTQSRGAEAVERIRRFILQERIHYA